MVKVVFGFNLGCTKTFYVALPPWGTAETLSETLLQYLKHSLRSPAGHHHGSVVKRNRSPPPETEDSEIFVNKNNSESIVNAFESRDLIFSTIPPSGTMKMGTHLYHVCVEQTADGFQDAIEPMPLDTRRNPITLLHSQYMTQQIMQSKCTDQADSKPPYLAPTWLRKILRRSDGVVGAAPILYVAIRLHGDKANYLEFITGVQPFELSTQNHAGLVHGTSVTSAVPNVVQLGSSPQMMPSSKYPTVRTQSELKNHLPWHLYEYVKMRVV